ncbi:hypothetical protein ACWDRR_30965 [Kitasatospora sp. NPDC003701]
MPEPVLRGDPPASVTALDAGSPDGSTGRAEPVDRAGHAHLADHAGLTGHAGHTDPADVADVADLAELDGQLIAQLLRRARCARAQQLGRRAAGLPASTLSQENAMLRQYSSRLGQPGAEIALAILALSRPPATRTRETDRRQ